MNIEKNQINESFLLVLKNDKDNKSKIVLDKVEIDFYFSKFHLDYIDKFVNKQTDKFEDLQALYRFMDKNNILEYLNDIEAIKKSYCKKLDGAYQEIDINIDFKNIMIIFNNLENLENCIDIFNMNSENNLKEFMEEVSYEISLIDKILSINVKYDMVEKNKDIIFFSHRKNGWQEPRCSLNKKLSVVFDTNFGYGSSSFFYVRLWYKNIQIIPFSEIIKYGYAGWAELKKFSRKYELKNAKWYDAMVFVKEANNILVDDEEKFIKTYIIDELENLLNALNYIISNNEFHILGCNGFETIKLEGIELLLFRAEKIVNTLDLIESINDFKNITDVEFFIETIVELNKKMKPMIEYGLKVISFDIESLKKDKSEIEPIYNKQKDIYNTCAEQVEKLIYRYHFLKKLKWINSSKNLNLIDFKYHLNALEKKTRMCYFNSNDNEIIDLNYPKYINIRSEYAKIEKKYNDISADLEKNIDYKEELKKFYGKSLDFFKNELLKL